MIFLILYDTLGQCLRVASTDSQQVADQFLASGFVEVSQDEYDNCAQLVEPATLSDLDQLNQANALISQGTTAPAQPIQGVRLNLPALRRLQAIQRIRYRDITQQYLDKVITIEQWDRSFLDSINAGNIAATSLAKGGLANLNQEDYRLIQRDNRTQSGYLRRFKRDIDTLTPATALNRATLYTGATTSRYWTAHTRAIGLPLLPAMPGVRTSCGSNCNCNWNIIQLAGLGDWDCQWRVSKSEHCPECLMRQRTFNPLRIRNGIVQPFNPNGLYG